MPDCLAKVGTQLIKVYKVKKPKKMAVHNNKVEALYSGVKSCLILVLLRCGALGSNPGDSGRKKYTKRRSANEKALAIRKVARQPNKGKTQATTKPVKIAPKGHPPWTIPTLKSRALGVENSDATMAKLGRIPPMPRPVINLKISNAVDGDVVLEGENSTEDSNNYKIVSDWGPHQRSE